MTTRRSPRLRALYAMRTNLDSGAWSPGDRLPTEEDLARVLDISRSTVRAAYAELEAEGRVVANGRAGRFRPAAKSESALSTTIALLTTHQEVAPSLFGGLLSAIDSGVLDAVRRAGRNLLVLHPQNLTAERMAQLLQSPPEGLVAIAVGQELAVSDWTAPLRHRGVPMALFSDEPTCLIADSVAFDHAAGGKMLTQHLLSRGCRRPLRLWGAQSTPWLEARDRGVEHVLQAAGVTPLAPVYVNNLTPRGSDSPDNLDQRARQYAGFLIEWLRGPEAADAILVATDADLYPVARACRLCGREPGRDVLLAGYDNFWDTCWERDHEPLVPAATVDKDNHACGAALVELLLDRIAGRLPSRPQRRWIAPQLVLPDIVEPDQ